MKVGESLSLDTDIGGERMPISQEPLCSKRDVSGKKEQREETKGKQNLAGRAQKNYGYSTKKRTSMEDSLEGVAVEVHIPSWFNPMEEEVWRRR